LPRGIRISDAWAFKHSVGPFWGNIGFRRVGRSTETSLGWTARAPHRLDDLGFLQESQAVPRFTRRLDAMSGCRCLTSRGTPVTHGCAAAFPILVGGYKLFVRQTGDATAVRICRLAARQKWPRRGQFYNGYSGGFAINAAGPNSVQRCQKLDEGFDRAGMSKDRPRAPADSCRRGMYANAIALSASSARK
jgi:hypothetical protein